MLGSFTARPARLEYNERVQRWTRERFALGDDTVVLVSEIDCAIPGCPPVETVVVFWLGERRRYRFKVFKPVADVRTEDVPVRWLLPALRDHGDLGCDCC